MRHNNIYIVEAERSDGQIEKPDQKTLELKRTGTLNPRPDSVSDTLFKENPFFDPKDLLQVRYEMLRRHSIEGISIVDVAANFGVSRPTVYQAQAAFQQAGLSGLLPKHRGPKEGHKLSAEVIEYVRDFASCRAWLDDCRLHQSHPGKIRDHGSPPKLGAGVSGQKKTAQSGVRSPIPEGTVEAYEGLRRQVIQPDGRGEHLEGHGVLMRCGMATWGQVKAVCRTGTFTRIAFSISGRNRPPSTRLEPNWSAW